LDNAGPALRRLVELNPMFHLIGLYRTALIGYPDYPFQFGDLVISLAWAVAVFVLGVAGFIRYETRMVRYL
jgi:ABC-type polysaccharide/polyol phosphate export permease